MKGIKIFLKKKKIKKGQDYCDRNNKVFEEEK